MFFVQSAPIKCLHISQTHYKKILYFTTIITLALHLSELTDSKNTQLTTICLDRAIIVFSLHPTPMKSDNKGTPKVIPHPADLHFVTKYLNSFERKTNLSVFRVIYPVDEWLVMNLSRPGTVRTIMQIKGLKTTPLLSSHMFIIYFSNFIYINPVFQ